MLRIIFMKEQILPSRFGNCCSIIYHVINHLNCLHESVMNYSIFAFPEFNLLHFELSTCCKYFNVCHEIFILSIQGHGSIGAYVDAKLIYIYTLKCYSIVFYLCIINLNLFPQVYLSIFQASVFLIK